MVPGSSQTCSVAKNGSVVTWHDRNLVSLILILRTGAQSQLTAGKDQRLLLFFLMCQGWHGHDKLVRKHQSGRSTVLYERVRVACGGVRVGFRDIRLSENFECDGPNSAAMAGLPRLTLPSTSPPR